MKKRNKLVSLLLVAALLLVNGTIAMADGIPTGETTLTGLNDTAVRQAVASYMDARADYLMGISDSMDWLVTGINNDEAAHLTKLAQKNITRNNTSYVIDSVECYDTEAYVVVNETVSYTKDGAPGMEVVTHELTVILYNDSVPIVVSDRYMELFCGFESCSYVAPNAQTYSVNASTNTGGSGLCIVNIALGEVGTVETGTNMTKYGEWYGKNGVAWCAIFVCWCANQANVSVSIIEKNADCDRMMKSFNDFGRFYFGADKGGSYTPQPGDVIVIGVYNDEVQDATHVGIVEKVVGNIVYTVEGNASDRVRHKNYSLSDSSIIGYGHPNYENSGHIASSYTSTSAGHSGTCMNCGAEFTEAHDLACVELDDSNHQDKCTVCQYVASTSAHTVGTDYHYDNTNHWHECGDCGHKEDVAAHTYGLYQSDSSAHWRVCTQCGGASARVAHRFLTKPNGSRYCRTCGYPNSFDEIEGGNIGEEAA